VEKQIIRQNKQHFPDVFTYTLALQLVLFGSPKGKDTLPFIAKAAMSMDGCTK
jgi:hypothetical protein